MAPLRLKAIVTEDRQLKLDLPEEVPTGAQVEITLEIAPTWTEEELVALMQDYKNIQPLTGKEIVALLKEMGTTGWEHIEDSAAWVEEQRRQARERSQW